MANSELYEKGMALRAELFGEEYAADMNESTYADPVMQKFRQVAAENIFGLLWSRPGLDLKTRTLVCVVSDAATGRDPELKLHLRMALRQGWTEDELTEVLIHLSGYVGVPLIREALLTASEVFKDVRGETP
ncbi:MAG: 4-carboxymuconolactone decarboxylase [Chromatiales bacterium]|jgi:4-carboxymuconolactone decarboxylase|nr:4-carboxymuconolactone decarboxylase [Chromatiales bacterium]